MSSRRELLPSGWGSRPWLPRVGVFRPPRVVPQQQVDCPSIGSRMQGTVHLIMFLDRPLSGPPSIRYAHAMAVSLRALLRMRRSNPPQSPLQKSPWRVQSGCQTNRNAVPCRTTRGAGSDPLLFGTALAFWWTISTPQVVIDNKL